MPWSRVSLRSLTQAAGKTTSPRLPPPSVKKNQSDLTNKKGGKIFSVARLGITIIQQTKQIKNKQTNKNRGLRGIKKKYDLDSMNPMLSNSFKEYTNWKLKVRIDSMELGGGGGGHSYTSNTNMSRSGINEGGGGGGIGELDRFLYDVDAIKEDMKTMEKLKQRLQEYNEDSRHIRVTTTMKELLSIMDSEMEHVLILAKAIMKRLESLARYRNNNHSIVGGGGGNRTSSGVIGGGGGPPGPTSSLEKTRMSVVSGVGKKLREIMDEYQGLRAKMAASYKETMEFIYLNLTSEKKYIEDIEKMISTGEIETVVRKTVEENSDEEEKKTMVDEVLEDIYQRREGGKHMQKQLIDLHQLLLEMVSVVETQTESQRTIQQQQQQQQQMMNRKGGGGGGGNSFIMRAGVAQLDDTNFNDDKDAKRRGIIAIILIIVLILFLIFPLFQFETDNGRE